MAIQPRPGISGASRGCRHVGFKKTAAFWIAVKGGGRGRQARIRSGRDLTRADFIRYTKKRFKSVGRRRYVSTKTLIEKLHVADTTLRAVTSMPSGTWLRATSPMNQPTEVAAISAVTTTSPPPVGADTK